jgi:ceramide glucosyltransferase
VLSEVTVETTVDEPTLGSLMRHQLRWLRTIRSIQPVGYALCVVTFSVPMAALGVVMTAGAASTLALLGVAVVARLALHLKHPRHGLHSALSQLGLVAVNDLLLLGLWCWSFIAPRVTWRQGRYHVERDGSLRPMA